MLVVNSRPRYSNNVKNTYEGMRGGGRLPGPGLPGGGGAPPPGLPGTDGAGRAEGAGGGGRDDPALAGAC